MLNTDAKNLLDTKRLRSALDRDRSRAGSRERGSSPRGAPRPWNGEGSGALTGGARCDPRAGLFDAAIQFSACVRGDTLTSATCSVSRRGTEAGSMKRIALVAVDGHRRSSDRVPGCDRVPGWRRPDLHPGIRDRHERLAGETSAAPSLGSHRDTPMAAGTPTASPRRRAASTLGWDAQHATRSPAVSETPCCATAPSHDGVVTTVCGKAATPPRSMSSSTCRTR